MNHPMYGIYNHAEKRWEYDRFGDLRAFSNRIFANAQADACWHRVFGRARVHRDGHEVIPVMEVIELNEENYHALYVHK